MGKEKKKPTQWKCGMEGCAETFLTKKQLYKHNEYYCHEQITQTNIIGETHILKPDGRKQLQGGIPKTDTNTYNNTIYCATTQQWQCIHCPKTFHPPSKRNAIMHTCGHILTKQRENPLKWEEWAEEQQITRDTRIRTLLNYGTQNTPTGQSDERNQHTPDNNKTNNKEQNQTLTQERKDARRTPRTRTASNMGKLGFVKRNTTPNTTKQNWICQIVTCQKQEKNQTAWQNT